MRSLPRTKAVRRTLQSKIRIELCKHYGRSDEKLSSLIFGLCLHCDEFEQFKAKLVENGAEFPDSSIVKILRVIKRIKTGEDSDEEDSDEEDVEIEIVEEQMLAANCIDKSELSDFNEVTGILPLPKEDSDEEDVDFEIVEKEPPFLHGHGRNTHELSPVRIVKNPDGSLAQAATMQSTLAKEPKEQKMIAREQEVNFSDQFCSVM